jgi:hypothetical protein
MLAADPNVHAVRGVRTVTWVLGTREAARNICPPTTMEIQGQTAADGQPIQAHHVIGEDNLLEMTSWLVNHAATCKHGQTVKVEAPTSKGGLMSSVIFRCECGHSCEHFLSKRRRVNVSFHYHYLNSAGVYLKFICMYL